MNKQYKIRELSPENVWDYENGYWWFGDITRFAKSLAHAELYRSIINLPGAIAEFGVYKASSLIRWLTLRELYESPYAREIVAFDAFGEFPKTSLKHVASDAQFVERFSSASGSGLGVDEVEKILSRKGFKNYRLVVGDVRNTLDQFLSESKHGRLALVHLDMDVFEPTLYVLERIYDCVVPGGLVLVDDYNTVEGATRAVDKFIKQHSGLELRKTKLNYTPAYIRKN